MKNQYFKNIRTFTYLPLTLLIGTISLWSNIAVGQTANIAGEKNARSQSQSPSTLEAAGVATSNDKRVTPEEAVAMVKKAIIYLKENGPEKTFAEINKKNGQFVDRELYLSVVDRNAFFLAHGGNIKMVGKTLLDLRDLDGKQFMRERMEIAKTKSSFWQDYRFANIVTKKIEPKSNYCETSPTGNLLICGGIYK